MRYSANLNIIVKAIEKATAHLSRDFIELENLQTNPFSANKFANACYNRIKQILADDFMRLRPDYNLVFSDGQKVTKRKDAEYSYIISPIDGLDNLNRASPDFTVAVALEHMGDNGQKESISVAISKLVGGELYYCEKGFGSYLNNRRIRVSKRATSETVIASCEDQSVLEKEIITKRNIKNFSPRSYGCRTMEAAYVASSRLEMAMFRKKNYDLLKPFLLLVREAGGKIVEEQDYVVISA